MITKRAGDDLFTEQQRDVRAGVRQAGRLVLDQSLAAAAKGAAAAAAADLAAVGHVAELSDGDYRNAKRGLMRSLRKAESKG
jgi:hypothetical protein